MKVNLRPWMSRNYLSLKRFYKQKKIKKTGEKMFLVKWKGYKNPSWTYEKDVVDMSQ